MSNDEVAYREVYEAMWEIKKPFPNLSIFVQKYDLFNYRTPEDFVFIKVEHTSDPHIDEINYKLRNREAGYLWVNKKTKQIQTHEVEVEATAQGKEEEKQRAIARHWKNVEYLKNRKLNQTLEKLKIKTLATTKLKESEEFQRFDTLQYKNLKKQAVVWTDYNEIKEKKKMKLSLEKKKFSIGEKLKRELQVEQKKLIANKAQHETIREEIDKLKEEIKKNEKRNIDKEIFLFFKSLEKKES